MTGFFPQNDILTTTKLCKYNWTEFQQLCELKTQLSFHTRHIIHPLYVGKNYKSIIERESGLSLAVGILLPE